jgi:hypothetical protein
MHPVDGVHWWVLGLYGRLYILKNGYLMCFDNQDCPLRHPAGFFARLWYPEHSGLAPPSPLQSRWCTQRLPRLITGGVGAHLWYPFSPLSPDDARRDGPGWYPEGLCPFMIPGTLWSGTPPRLQSRWWCRDLSRLIPGGGFPHFWYPERSGLVPLLRLSPDDDDEDDDCKWCSLLLQETNKPVPDLKLESRVAFMSGPSTR